MPDRERPRYDERRSPDVSPGEPPAGESFDVGREEPVIVSPHLLVRHAVVALAVVLVVVILALLFDAPLREVANPTVTPNPEKAPWYFIALQELLAHVHPLVGGVLVPAAVVLGLAALPYLDRNPSLSPQTRRVAKVTFTIFLVAWIVLTVIGFAFRGPGWSWVWPWEEWHGEL